MHIARAANARPADEPVDRDGNDDRDTEHGERTNRDCCAAREIDHARARDPVEVQRIGHRISSRRQCKTKRRANDEPGGGGPRNPAENVIGSAAAIEKGTHRNGVSHDREQHTGDEGQNDEKHRTPRPG